MTEQEARKKWCPFARRGAVLDENYVAAVNRLSDMDNWPKCIASDCMAWRWSEELDKGWAGKDGTNKTNDGYCGLAGKP